MNRLVAGVGLGGSFLALAAGAVFWPRTPAESARAITRVPPRRASVPSFVASPAPSPPAASPAATDVATSLVDRLTELFSAGADAAAIDAVERLLLPLGDAGARACLDRLDRKRGGREDAPAVRNRLFHLLRRIPGGVAEERLLAEARHGAIPAWRAMAIESLAGRQTERAFATLAAVATHDGVLPAQPLISQPRQPDDPSTEVPDERVFTPRMQAMAALATTKTARAAAILGDIVEAGPDESLRMEAARNLGELREHPRALAALRQAAERDPSAYVRLSALRALMGASDNSLPPVLENIAAGDRDAGVRILAREVLASLER